MAIRKGFLTGKRTYIVAASILISGLIQWGLGEIELGQVIFRVLEAGGLGALRAGVSKA